MPAFKPEYGIFALGAALVIGWFAYKSEVFGTISAPVSNTTIEEGTALNDSEMSASPRPASAEQPALSSSTELSAIEDDVNATVIYDEDLNDLK